MADRNRTLGLQRASRAVRRFSAHGDESSGSPGAPRVRGMARYEWFDGALCRRHVAGSGRLCPPGPRRLAPDELADADAGGRGQPCARRRSRTQQGGGGRVARNLRDGERLWIDEIGEHGIRRWVVADTCLHLRLLFQPVGRERGDRRLSGARRFRREIHCCQSHAADLVNYSSRRHSWPMFEPTHSQSVHRRSRVLPEPASVRSRRSSSATPTKPARDR